MNLPDIKEAYINFHPSTGTPQELTWEKGETKVHLAEECFNTEATSGTNWKSQHTTRQDGGLMSVAYVPPCNKKLKQLEASTKHVFSE